MLRQCASVETRVTTAVRHADIQLLFHGICDVTHRQTPQHVDQTDVRCWRGVWLDDLPEIKDYIHRTRTSSEVRQVPATAYRLIHYNNWMESTLTEHNSPPKLLRIATTMGGARLMEQSLPQCWSTNHVPSWICIFGMFTRLPKCEIWGFCRQHLATLATPTIRSVQISPKFNVLYMLPMAVNVLPVL